MTERPTVTTRRRLLGTVGGVAALGLAGCLGYSGPTGDGSGAVETPTPTTAPTSTATEGHHEVEEHHEEEEHPHEEGGHGSAGPADHVEVEMITNETGDHFHPHVAWVMPGGTVTFHNVSGAHTATAYHPANGKPLRIPEGADPFDSGLLTGPGDTFEHAFEMEGVYDIYCVPHEALGMIGTVLVGEPDPHGQPGLAEPQAEFTGRMATKIADLNHQVNETLGHTHDDEVGAETETEHHEEDDHHEGTETEHSL